MKTKFLIPLLALAFLFFAIGYFAGGQNGSDQYFIHTEKGTGAYIDAGRADAYAFPDQPAKLDINTATALELTDLPGVGEKLANEIVNYREKHGEFNFITELGIVPGMTSSVYDRIRDLVMVK